MHNCCQVKVLYLFKVKTCITISIDLLWFGNMAKVSLEKSIGWQEQKLICIRMHFLFTCDLDGSNIAYFIVFSLSGVRLCYMFNLCVKNDLKLSDLTFNFCLNSGMDSKSSLYSKNRNKPLFYLIKNLQLKLRIDCIFMWIKSKHQNWIVKSVNNFAFLKWIFKCICFLIHSKAVVVNKCCSCNALRPWGLVNEGVTIDIRFNVLLNFC